MALCSSVYSGTGYVGPAFNYSISEDATGLVDSSVVQVTVLPPNVHRSRGAKRCRGWKTAPTMIELLNSPAGQRRQTEIRCSYRGGNFPEQGSVAFDVGSNVVHLRPITAERLRSAIGVSDGEFEREATATGRAPINNARRGG
jgi:hypothetical protein